MSMASPVLEGANNGISGIVSSVILGLWKKLQLSYKEYMVPVPEHFIQYTSDSYDRFSRVKCLAKGQAIMPLKKIYVPLTLNHLNNTKADYFVDHYDEGFFYNNRQLLIVDTAGMGKSTLAKRLYIDIIDKGTGIPIFIELRRLSQSHSFISELLDQVSGLTGEFDQELLYSFIRDGNFIFILDGYDEIALAEKDVVTYSLQDFINHASENTFIMTSRQEIALTSFSGFETYKIKPLSKSEAFSLLRTYDDDDKEVSSLLIGKLKETDDFDDFLGNPLLASMLLTAFSFKNEIPRQKHVFYRTVFDAYFNSHDLTKGGAYQHEKHSGLVIEEFHKVLRFMGILCLKKDRIEFTKDELIDTIERALKLCPEIHCSSGDFLMDILEVVPLFVQEGHFYRWAHKSLYEYFAAQNIYRDIQDKEKALLALSSEDRVEKSYNLLDLYYEIDYTSFRNVIIRRLFQELVDYVENTGDMSSISIRWKQCFFFCPEFFLIEALNPVGEKGSIGDVVHTVFEETHYNAMSFTHDDKKAYFVFRNADQKGREFLLILLESKNNPAISQINHIEKVSIEGLEKGHVYRLNEKSLSDFDIMSLAKIIPLVESLGPLIEYDTAKQELLQIDANKREADAFAEELFS